MSFSADRVRTLFARPDYRRLWTVGALTGVSRWLEFIALGIYAYELTHSPPLVALLAVLRMMPYVALGFVMGALADRFDRRLLLMAGIGLVLGTAVAMTVATGLGAGGYSAVAAAVAVSGAFWTLDMPVRRRLLVDAAGQDNMSAALGFDNSTTYMTRGLGPLIGGATYQMLGISGIYAMIAVCNLACLCLAWRVGAERRHAVAASPAAGPRKAGLREAFSIPRELVFNRRFAVIMGVTLVYNLACFPFTTMVPVIAQKDFLLAPTLVGALSACEGLGGTVGALAVGMLGSDRTLFRIYFFGVLSLLLLMLGLSQHLEVLTAAGALVLMGVCAACFSATQYALVYVISPPEVRGRATGVLSLFIGSAMIGHYTTGQLFDRLASPQAMQVMALSGLTAMAVLGTIWWTAPADKRGAA